MIDYYYLTSEEKELIGKAFSEYRDNLLTSDKDADDDDFKDYLHCEVDKIDVLASRLALPEGAYMCDLKVTDNKRFFCLHDP